MASGIGATVNPAGHRTEGATPERRRAHIPRDEARRLTWLNWRSNGCEHGLKRHHVALDGNVQEINDLPRRKPKAVSSRQWEAV